MLKPDRHVDVKQHIAVFASGAGSNAQKIIGHFNREKSKAKVVLIVCSKAGAGVLKIAEKEKIATVIIDRKKFYDDAYLEELNEYKIDLIVLAGFMWKVPDKLIRSYPNKIINIHPALLPKYGGKNMYGSFVHEAVLKAGEKESGITIHYVDELYDHGEIIFQAKCKVDEGETTETLAQKIHVLEHQHYPPIIERILSAYSPG
jgi:phosphoribosylglycinamide formyltransferase-1